MKKVLKSINSYIFLQFFIQKNYFIHIKNLIIKKEKNIKFITKNFYLRLNKRSDDVKFPIVIEIEPFKSFHFSSLKTSVVMVKKSFYLFFNSYNIKVFFNVLLKLLQIKTKFFNYLYQIFFFKSLKNIL